MRITYRRHSCQQARPDAQHHTHSRNALPGLTLVEVVVALVVLAGTAAWSLLAVAASLRAHGASELHRDALQRAELALATFDDVPCDSTVVPLATSEPRWLIAAARQRSGNTVRTVATVTPASPGSDSVRLQRVEWCR